MMEQEDRTPMYNFKPFTMSEIVYVKDQIKPMPRSGHRIVCSDFNLYSFGGYNPNMSTVNMIDGEYWSSKPLFKELWKYNFASSTWTKLRCGQTPDMVASNAVALSGRLIMVHGGTGVPFGDNSSNELLVCDVSKPTGLTFEKIDSHGNQPQQQYGQAIVLNEHYIYTVGGTTGYEYNIDVHCLDFKTREWKALYAHSSSYFDWEPKGRYRHEVAFDGTRIYVFGGGTAQKAYNFLEIPTFNVKTCHWERLVARGDPQGGSKAAYPEPRRCHSCVTIPGTYLSVMILGGYNGKRMFSDVWRLDIPDLQWTRLTGCCLPKQLYFHSSAVTPSGLLVTFGGIAADSNCTTLTTQRSSRLYSCWVTIPKLKEISWQAVLFYNPLLHLKSKRTLLNYGLPIEFIQRFEAL